MQYPVFVCTLAVLSVFTPACAGAHYKASLASETGGAVAPPGVSAGTTNRIHLEDSGGPLTRIGLLGFALGAVASSAENIKSTRTTTREGNIVTTTTTTTGTLNQERAAAAKALAESALADQPVPLYASLDIATTALGGDTSGWMYNIGYRSEPLVLGRFAVLRTSFGLGFGRYNFHDRERRLRGGTADDGVMGDYRYTYIGTPLRFTLHHTRWLRSYFQADLNWVSAWDLTDFSPTTPSPWRVGAQANLGPLFVKGELSWSRMMAEDSSIGVEVGLGF